MAEPRTATGQLLSGRAVVWTSDNPNIADVAANGAVTARGPGSVLIHAAIEGRSSSASIHVTPVPVASLTLTPSSTSLQVGESEQLTATPRDAGGNLLADRTITWSSSDEGVATVSTTGVVTGLDPGQATITAVVEGHTSTAEVQVTPIPVASVSVSPAASSLFVGQSEQLTAVTRDASGNPLDGREVTWQSSNTEIAVVTESGTVTAVGVGEATITATSEEVNGTATLSVALPPITALAVSPAEASVSAGRPQQFSATPRDAEGNRLSGRAITWSSSDPSRATINEDGLVTTISPGTVTITATSEGKQSEATLVVRPRATTRLGTGFSDDEFALIPAGTFQMGSLSGPMAEQPVHFVTITEPFYIQKTELTERQWREIMGSREDLPEEFCGDFCPVNYVSWLEVQEFIRALNERFPDRHYRLPTEAEWEYAARAGTTGDYGGTGVLDDMGWWLGNADSQRRPVALKQPNAWGLYDMHGNVWEWVYDRYCSYPDQERVDPNGDDGSCRNPQSVKVKRGGSFNSIAFITRSAYRNYYNAEDSYGRGSSYSETGFRLVRTR